LLEGSAGRGEKGVVARIEVVEDGFGKGFHVVEEIQEPEQAISLRPVAYGVESGVGTELIEVTGIGIAYGRKVELHGPVPFRIPAPDLLHEEGGELVDFGGVNGEFLAAGALENRSSLLFGAGFGGTVAHPVIREAASRGVKVVMTLVQCLKKFREGLDFHVAFLPELIAEGIENVGTVDHGGLVRPEGGINLCFEIEGGTGLVMRKGMGGIIGGPHCIHPEAGEQSMCTEVVFGKALVSGMPYIFRGVRVEQGVDAEAATEFEMGPMEERISGGMRNGFSPGLEFFPG